MLGSLLSLSSAAIVRNAIRQKKAAASNTGATRLAGLDPAATNDGFVADYRIGLTATGRTPTVSVWTN
ncbi:hypothetical protein ABZ746_13750 [Streptomyces sp. NPDC020096]